MIQRPIQRPIQRGRDVRSFHPVFPDAGAACAIIVLSGRGILATA
ncbi:MULTISPECIES: hypothetical protein [Acidiphilium]|nr:MULTISPECIES: hypothetical protein [Acidiphilium]